MKPLSYTGGGISEPEPPHENHPRGLILPAEESVQQTGKLPLGEPVRRVPGAAYILRKLLYRERFRTALVRVVVVVPVQSQPPCYPAKIGAQALRSGGRYRVPGAQQRFAFAFLSVLLAAEYPPRNAAQELSVALPGGGYPLFIPAPRTALLFPRRSHRHLLFCEDLHSYKRNSPRFVAASSNCVISTT